MKSSKWMGLVFLVAMAPTVALSNVEAFEIDAEVKERIESVVTKSGAKANYFEGPSGTIGIGLSMPNGKQMVVYATPDGGALFSGVAVDTTTGENLTRRDLENELPPPDFSGILDSAKRAQSISDGTEGAETEFYVFVDPHCPYCHKAYQIFEALKAEGRDFQVHWIPVGTLSAKSQNSAKAILGVSPEEQMTALVDFMSNTSGPALKENIEKGDKLHQLNLSIFRELQFSGVPVVITKRGEDVAVKEALPQISVLRAAIMTQKVAMQ